MLSSVKIGQLKVEEQEKQSTALIVLLSLRQEIMLGRGRNVNLAMKKEENKT